MKEKNFFVTTMVSLCVTAIGTLLLLTMIHTIKEVDTLLASNFEETTDTVKIHSVASASELEGRSFILGRGYIEENPYYIAYIVNENGGLELFKMDANTTTLYLTLDNPDDSFAEITYNDFGVVHVNLHLPSDAIQQEYDLSVSSFY